MELEMLVWYSQIEKHPKGYCVAMSAWYDVDTELKFAVVHKHKKSHEDVEQ